MNGGEGNDGVYAGVGDDQIVFGGPGRDEISGDWGVDRLNSRDGEVDIVNCGFNYDTANVDDDPSTADPNDSIDLVSPDCEEVYPF